LAPDTEHVKISDTTGDLTEKGGDFGEYKKSDCKKYRQVARISNAYSSFKPNEQG
jgi:hypothetical protein